MQCVGTSRSTSYQLGGGPHLPETSSSLYRLWPHVARVSSPRSHCAEVCLARLFMDGLLRVSRHKNGECMRRPASSMGSSSISGRAYGSPQARPRPTGKAFGSTVQHLSDKAKGLGLELSGREQGAKHMPVRVLERVGGSHLVHTWPSLMPSLLVRYATLSYMDKTPCHTTPLTHP